MAPLILTLELDPASQAWFDRLRSAYFPAGRLVVGAHVTMFHALPGEREAEIARGLAALCGETSAFAVEFAGAFSLGRGVAFRLRAPPAERLRRALLSRLSLALTAQNSAAWSPHVTVQNKVSADEARRTLAELAGESPPGAIQATGVALWRYLGGPWEMVCTHSFAPSPASTFSPSPSGRGSG